MGQVWLGDHSRWLMVLDTRISGNDGELLKDSSQLSKNEL